MDNSSEHTHNIMNDNHMHSSTHGNGLSGRTGVAGATGVSGTSGHSYQTGASNDYNEFHAQGNPNPADQAIAFAREHPLLAGAAVAAVVATVYAIGPRRIGRTLGTALTSGGALTALTLRNPSNLDALTRLLNTVSDVLQQTRDSQRRP